MTNIWILPFIAFFFHLTNVNFFLFLPFPQASVFMHFAATVNHYASELVQYQVNRNGDGTICQRHYISDITDIEMFKQWTGLLSKCNVLFTDYFVHICRGLTFNHSLVTVLRDLHWRWLSEMSKTESQPIKSYYCSKNCLFLLNSPIFLLPLTRG